MYALKIKGSTGSHWLQFFSEVKGQKGVLTFRDQGDAELYAQNHEVKNYTIEVYDDSATRSQGPQLIND